MTNLTFTRVDYDRASHGPQELHESALLVAEQIIDSAMVVVVHSEAEESVRRSADHLIALSMDDDSLDWETLGRVDELAWGADAVPR